MTLHDGHALSVDERALRAELRGRQPEIDVALSTTARQEPYWRAMCQRAAATDVGFTRWAGSGR